jgi:hypothetical protein
VATILYDISTKVLKVSLPKVNKPVDFADKDKIDSKSVGAVSALQQADVINGKPGNKFDPKGTITRAEMAAIADRITNIKGLEIVPKK